MRCFDVEGGRRNWVEWRGGGLELIRGGRRRGWSYGCEDWSFDRIMVLIIG